MKPFNSPAAGKPWVNHRVLHHSWLPVIHPFLFSRLWLALAEARGSRLDLSTSWLFCWWSASCQRRSDSRWFAISTLSHYITQTSYTGFAVLGKIPQRWIISRVNGRDISEGRVWRKEIRDRWRHLGRSQEVMEGFFFSSDGVKLNSSHNNHTEVLRLIF